VAVHQKTNLWAPVWLGSTTPTVTTSTCYSGSNVPSAMSAFGGKATSRKPPRMSAFGTKRTSAHCDPLEQVRCQRCRFGTPSRPSTLPLWHPLVLRRSNATCRTLMCASLIPATLRWRHTATKSHQRSESFWSIQVNCRRGPHKPIRSKISPLITLWL